MWSFSYTYGRYPGNGAPAESTSQPGIRKYHGPPDVRIKLRCAARSRGSTETSHTYAFALIGALLVGSPVLAAEQLNPVTGNEEAILEVHTSKGTEIYWQEKRHDGSRFANAITENEVDDVEPQLCIETFTGNSIVLYTRKLNPPTVHMRIRDGKTKSWQSEVQLSVPGRFPTCATVNGNIAIAYATSLEHSAPAIVVDILKGCQGPECDSDCSSPPCPPPLCPGPNCPVGVVDVVHFWVASLPAEESLRPVIQSNGTYLWVAWPEKAGIAFSWHHPSTGWSAVQYIETQTPEEAFKLIRERMSSNSPPF